jgi:hypothetical protein
MADGAATANYRFLDVDLLLCADRAAVVDECDRYFGRFRAADTSAAVTVSVAVTTDPDRGYAEERLPDGSTRPIPWPIPPEWYLSLTDVALTASRLPSFHAGSVSLGNAGAVLCASSGTGKTSLTLGLAATGCAFLSDELAPIDPETGIVNAYPRAVGLREGTARLFGLEVPRETAGGPPGSFRRFVDPGSLPGVTLAPSARLALVVFLVPPRGAGEEGFRFLELGFSRLPDGLEAALAGIAGVAGVTRLSGRHYMTLRLKVVGETRVSGAVEAMTARLGAPVAVARWGDFGEPRYDDPPACRDLPASEALVAWRRHLLNPGALSGGKGDGMVLFKLASLARGVRFVELTVGSMDQMVDVVTGMLRDGGGSGS